ncbi:MAG: NAD(+) diphosphatase [Oscillospiraceae bacterium]|nr:NAD(+) diphosphatase [Oscillospiraceae bacterium]
MLQDFPFGRLYNEYRQLQPEPEDSVICFCGNQVLLKQSDIEASCIPSLSDVLQWAGSCGWVQWQAEMVQYLFEFHGRRYFLWMGEVSDTPISGCRFENMRLLMRQTEKEPAFVLLTAWHLFVWYRNNRFCGRCGSKTVHDTAERMMRCPSCGNLIFPRISPAIITGVTHGDRLLLTKYAGRIVTRYALIAGYTEIGETLEQTVQREVMEEVGLRVTNIRYYKSQPWGIDGNVLMGFYCDLEGEETIHLDERELAVGQWFDRDDLPDQDDGLTLTQEMIRVFKECREPK